MARWYIYRVAGTVHIDVQVHTRAKADDVYALLRDGASWPAWAPIDSFHLERSGNAERVGEVWVFRQGKVTGRDQIVKMVPGRRFVYRHLSGLPVRDYRGDIELEPTGRGTRIRWHICFKPMAAGTAWLLRWMIRRFIQRCADGLATFALTVAARER
jgi:hypothetical protein